MMRILVFLFSKQNSALLILVFGFSLTLKSEINDSFSFESFNKGLISFNKIKSEKSIIIYNDIYSCIDCKKSYAKYFSKRRFKSSKIYILIKGNGGVLYQRSIYNEWLALLKCDFTLLFLPQSNSPLETNNLAMTPHLFLFNSSHVIQVTLNDFLDVNNKIIKVTDIKIRSFLK